MSNNLKNKAVIVSNIVYENTLRGYKLYVVGKGVQNIFLNKIKQYPLANLDIINAKYIDGDLVGTYLPLSKYPVVDMDNIIQKQGIVVLAVILDRITQRPIGALVINPLGNQYNVTFTNLKLMLQKYPAVNFKFGASCVK